MKRISAIKLAVMFHDIYERLAPDFGYETRKDTKNFNARTPNGKLMIAVCGEISDYFYKLEGEHEDGELAFGCFNETHGTCNHGGTKDG